LDLSTPVIAELKAEIESLEYRGKAREAKNPNWYHSHHGHSGPPNVPTGDRSAWPKQKCRTEDDIFYTYDGPIDVNYEKQFEKEASAAGNRPLKGDQGQTVGYVSSSAEASSSSGLAVSARGDPGLERRTIGVRDSWMTESVITLKAAAGVCNDPNALAAAGESAWSSLSDILKSLGTLLMKSVDDEDIKLPPKVIDLIVKSDAPSLAKIIKNPFTKPGAGSRTLMILSDSTLHLSQKGNANKFLQECIESYTTHFYAKVVIEVIDGATAKKTRRKNPKVDRRRWRWLRPKGM
jgi:hypothetical protein